MGVLQDGDAACKIIRFGEKLVVWGPSKPCGGHSDINETVEQGHDSLGEIFEGTPFEGAGLPVDLERCDSARVGV